MAKGTVNEISGQVVFNFSASQQREEHVWSESLGPLASWTPALRHCALVSKGHH